MKRSDLIEFKSILDESATKEEIKSMIKDALDKFLREDGLRRKIREIGTDILDDFFKQMWNKKSFWKSGLKNG